MDVDYISAMGGVMSFTKLYLRMERQRNSTSHQNILPSTAPLLRNTRSGQDSVINKLPTLLEALEHKHSPRASLPQQKNIKREDRVQPVNRLSVVSHACRWGAVYDYGQVVSVCAWDTPGHSSHFLSAPFSQPRCAEKTGGGVKNNVAPSGSNANPPSRSKAELPQASCLKCNYSKPAL